MTTPTTTQHSPPPRFDLINSDPVAKPNNFDFIRFCLASVVIISHAYELNGVPDPMKRPTHDVLPLGTLAVMGFFVTSGYLVTASWVRRPVLKTYLWNRFSRIVPGFIVAVLVSLVVAYGFSPHPPGSWAAGPVAKRIALSVVTLSSPDHPDAFPLNRWPTWVNGSMWTIPLEVMCYLALPVCYALARRTRLPFWSLLLALLCAGVGYFVVITLLKLRVPNWMLFVRVLAYLVPFFMAGALLYLFQHRLPRRGWIILACGAVALPAALLVPKLLYVWFLTFGAYGVMRLAFARSGPLARFGYYGDFSYGVYLYAFPIQQALIASHGGVMTPRACFVLTWPFAIAAGVLSWHLIEKRFLSRHRVRKIEGMPG